MSNILDKPFSFVNRIARAIFKGSPNLLTSSDLNRQIEALCESDRLLQNTSLIISDLSCSLNGGGVTRTLTASLSYVYADGVEFNFSNNRTFQLNINGSGEKILALFSKKTLVTFDTDPSKSVSGAKFEDGSEYPAADHYVYTDYTIEMVDYPSSGAWFQKNNDRDFIAALAIVKYESDKVLVQLMTVPRGKTRFSNAEKYRNFSNVVLLDKDSCASHIPKIGDNISESLKKTYDRVYSLEKRLFFDQSTEQYRGASTKQNHNVNGTNYPSRGPETFTAVYGSTKVVCKCFWYISGGTCFSYVDVTLQSNTSGVSSILGLQSIEISNIIGGQNKLPHTLIPIKDHSRFVGSVSITENNVVSDTRNVDNIVVATISDNDTLTIEFPFNDNERVSYSKLKFGFSFVYPIDTSTFWKVSEDDTKGIFKDY